MKLKFTFANGEIAVAAGNRDYLSLAQDADPLATELTDYAFGTYDGEKLFVSSRGGITPTDDELHYWLDRTGLWEVTAAHVPVQFKFVEHGDPRLVEWAADMHVLEGIMYADAIFGFVEQRVVAGLFYLPEADRISVELAVVMPEFRASDVFMQLAHKLVAEIPDKPIQMMTVWPGMKRIVDRWNSQFTTLPDDLGVHLFGPDDARPGQGWPVQKDDPEPNTVRQPGPYNTFLYDRRAWSSVWKTAATVDDTEPKGLDVGFLRDPHETLYPPLFDGDVMREQARARLKSHMLNEIEKEYYHADQWIYFTCYGSGISYNWDEHGDLDVQMWVDVDKYNSIHSDDPQTSEQLVADVRRILMPINFVTCRQLELTDGAGEEDVNGDMVIQWFAKAGTGSEEENLAQKPYAAYDLETGKWLVHPKPLSPLYFGEWFLLIEPKAREIATQISAVIENYERDVMDAQFWARLYQRYQNPRYRERMEESRDLAEQDKKGVRKLFLQIYRGRQQAYSPEGQGNEDERDLLQKLLEVWGVFQRLRMVNTTELPWKEEIPSPEKQKQSNETYNQRLRANAEIDLTQPPDASQVVHDFGDGHTIRQITNLADKHREGVMQRNCWRLTRPFLNPDGTSKPLTLNNGAGPCLYYHSLRDSNNLPLVSFHVFPGMRRMNPEGEWFDDAPTLYNALGARNSVPSPEEFDKLREFATAKGYDIRDQNMLRQMRGDKWSTLSSWLPRVGTLWHPRREAAWLRAWERYYEGDLLKSAGDVLQFPERDKPSTTRGSCPECGGRLYYSILHKADGTEEREEKCGDCSYTGETREAPVFPLRPAHVVTAAAVDDLAQKMVESILARPDIQELQKTAEEVRAGGIILSPFEDWLNRQSAGQSWDDTVTSVTQRLNSGALHHHFRGLDLPPIGEVTPEWTAKELAAANKKKKLVVTPRLAQLIVDWLPRVQAEVPQAYKMFPWMVRELKDIWAQNYNNTGREIAAQKLIDIVENYGPLFAQYQNEQRLPKGFDLNQMSLTAFETWAKEELRDPHADNSTVVYQYQDGWTIRALGADPQDFIDEGEEMGNCLRQYQNYHWLRKLEDGYSVFFSLRTPNNHPQVSIEAVGPEGGGHYGGWPRNLDVCQEYAHGNSTPNPELRARLDEWYQSLSANGITVTDDGHGWDWDEENEEEQEPQHLEDNDEWVDHPEGGFLIDDLADLHEYARAIRLNVEQFRDQTEMETHEDDEGNWWFSHYNGRTVEVNDDAVSGAIANEAEHSTTTEDQEQVYDDLETLLIACRHEGYDSWEDILGNLRDHLTAVAEGFGHTNREDVGYRVLQNAIRYAESLSNVRAPSPVNGPLPLAFFGEQRQVQNVHAEQLPSYEEYTGQIFEDLNSQQAFLPPASQEEAEEQAVDVLPGHPDQLNLDENNLTPRARDLYRYIQVRGVFQRIREGDAPDKVEAAIQQLLRYGIGIGNDAERRAVEMYMNNIPLRQFGSQKTGSWTDIMNKAQKIRGSGGVSLLNNGYNHIIGRVQGDHNEYTTQVWRQDPASRAISMWDCRVLNVTEPMEVDGKQVAPGDPCPWQQFVWGRTRQFKKFEGRPCAHTLALYWESLGQPLDDQGGGGGAPGAPPATPPPAVPAAPPPPAPAAGPIPMNTPVTPIPPDTTPVGPMIPGGTNPIPNMAPAAMGGPSTAPPPSAAPAAGPIPAGNPAGAAPTGPVSEQQQPGQGGTVSLPGALSSWKLAAGPFKNGDIVRANRPLNGTDRDDVTWQIPRNAKGEVLDSDETTVWVAFPLHMTGQLEPHLVRVQTPVEAVSLSSGSPFIRRR